MTRPLTRRNFLAGAATLAGAGLVLPAGSFAAGPAPVAPVPSPSFPRVDLAAVEAFVGISHRDPGEVARMLERQPALARASWDWGFGDWETGLGAAAHTGGREIAELILARGAEPTIFSAAMLGQLEVVRAMIAARPGVQRSLGPHAITLMNHAKAGGKPAEAVVAYLESVGGADTRPATAALVPAERDAIVGRYRFGSGELDRFEVDVRSDAPGIQRPGGSRRTLFHTGGLAFFPAGVPSVRIAFMRDGDAVTHLTVADPEPSVTAVREA